MGDLDQSQAIPIYHKKLDRCYVEIAPCYVEIAPCRPAIPNLAAGQRTPRKPGVYIAPQVSSYLSDWMHVPVTSALHLLTKEMESWCDWYMYMHVGSNPIILSKILFKNGRWMTHKCFLEFAVILNGFGGKQFRNCMCCLCKRVPVLVSCLLWLLCSCSLFVLLTLQLCSFVPPFRSGLCGPESFLALLPWFIVDFAALSFIFYGQFCGSLFVCFFEIALKFHCFLCAFLKLRWNSTELMGAISKLTWAAKSK